MNLTRYFVLLSLHLAVQFCFAQWQPANNGIPGILNVNSFATSGNIFLAGGSEDLGSLTLCRTTNVGQSWSLADSGIVPFNDSLRTAIGGISSIVADQFRIYAAGVTPKSRDSIHLSEPGIFMSQTGGRAWRRISPRNGRPTTGLLARTNFELFAFTNDKIFSTSDEGVTWDSSRTMPSPPNSRIEGIIFDTTEIWMIVSVSASPAVRSVYFSPDFGISWFYISSLFAGFDMKAFFKLNDYLFVGGYSRNQVALFRGSTWGWAFENLYTGISPFSSINAFASSGNILFAAGSEPPGIPVVFKSTNAGDTWIRVSNGLQGGFVNQLAVHQGYLFAGLKIFGGVWRRPLSNLATSTDDHYPTPPTSFALHQNYPNPFNPTTKIKFQIPVGSGQVAPSLLKVFDVLGEEVAVLKNEVLEPGTYTVSFDGSNLSSGVYYYRLDVGSFSATRKLLLMK